MSSNCSHRTLHQGCQREWLCIHPANPVIDCLTISRSVIHITIWGSQVPLRRPSKRHHWWQLSPSPTEGKPNIGCYYVEKWIKRLENRSMKRVQLIWNGRINLMLWTQLIASQYHVPMSIFVHALTHLTATRETHTRVVATLDPNWHPFQHLHSQAWANTSWSRTTSTLTSKNA